MNRNELAGLLNEQKGAFCSERQEREVLLKKGVRESGKSFDHS
jgi:hypothetical protein